MSKNNLETMRPIF